MLTSKAFIWRNKDAVCPNNIIFFSMLWRFTPIPHFGTPIAYNEE
jgi:hypothetical protein